MMQFKYVNSTIEMTTNNQVIGSVRLRVIAFVLWRFALLITIIGRDIEMQFFFYRGKV